MGVISGGPANKRSAQIGRRALRGKRNRNRPRRRNPAPKPESAQKVKALLRRLTSAIFVPDMFHVKHPQAIP
jgi:hypothetical protein